MSPPALQFLHVTPLFNSWVIYFSSWESRNASSHSSIGPSSANSRYENFDSIPASSSQCVTYANNWHTYFLTGTLSCPTPVENQGMHRRTVKLGQAQPTAGMKILIRYLPVLVNMCTCMCDICQWLILLFSRRNFALPNYSWESWIASSHSSIGPSSSNTRYLHIEATKYKKKTNLRSI
jgi:hypothetical protein